MLARGPLALALALAGTGLPAQEAALARPRVALALSGGGARGIAHIGALRALEQAGIPVDAIAGTSMGAAIGAMYAGGYSTHEIEAAIKSMDWPALFAARADRGGKPLAYRDDGALALVSLGFEAKRIKLPVAAFSDYQVNRFLIRHLSAPGFAAEDDFARLRIPFVAMATALDDGERLVLASGSLPLAVRASMSVPVAFAPVAWNGRLLVDGGLVDNLPIRAARDLGADVVIAVDVQTPPFKPSQYRDVVGIANQVTGVLSDARNREHAAPADVLVTPDLGGHPNTDYADIDVHIERGKAATELAIPAIREKLAAAAERGAVRPPSQRPPPGATLGGTRIAQLAVVGNQGYAEALVRRIFDVPVGAGFDLQRTLRGLDKLHATAWFDWLWMDLDRAQEGGLRITLRVSEGPPTRLEAGAGYDEPERAKGFVRLRRRNVLGFGEQLDLVFQGSDALRGTHATLLGERIVKPWLGYRLTAFSLDEKPRFFREGREVNRARFDRDGLLGLLRRPVGRNTLVEAGFGFGRVLVRERQGIEFERRDDDVRTLVAGVAFDSLNDLALPEAGASVSVRGERSPHGLGATHDYWRGWAEAHLPRRVGSRTTLQLDALGGASGGSLPPYELLRLGGPVLLPGLHTNELWGEAIGAAALSARVRCVRELRAVARFGVGKAWARREDVSLSDLEHGFGIGLLHPTRIGPVGVELGFLSGRKALLTFSIGHP